jgi:hypothetical protein
VKVKFYVDLSDSLPVEQQAPNLCPTTQPYSPPISGYTRYSFEVDFPEPEAVPLPQAAVSKPMVVPVGGEDEKT